jgi:hypothetical protein
MRKLLIIFFMLLIHAASHAQTIAPDFTATDCNGDIQNLYTELNNGKTVIVIWVMPCIGCIDGTVAADDARSSLSGQYPNSVLLWIVDDGPPSNCSTVNNWVSSIGMQPQRTFGNYSNEIDQDSYGGFGMPHITVIGPNKQIYYNEFNTQGSGLEAAVENAINMTTSIAETKEALVSYISPNPVSGSLTIVATEELESVSVISLTGQIVKHVHLHHAKKGIISVDDIVPGTYMIRFRESNGKTGWQRVVKM